jgi:hypothetical protein
MTDARTSNDSPPGSDDITSLLRRWTDAELRGDADVLDGLLAPDFTGVGPLGFILSRTDWLERHRSHDLAYARFEYDEVTIQRHPGCAVVVARQDSDGTWQGHPVPGILRVSLVLVPAEGGWQVAFSQTSFMAGTPGAPPIPGRPGGTKP